MKRILIALLLVTGVSGCLGNLSSDGIFSTLSSTGASVVGTAVGGPILGVTAGVAAGVATDAAVKPSNPLNEIPVEDRADVLKHQKLYEAVEHIGLWLILSSVFVFFILPLIVGWINSAIKSSRYKNDMINTKEALFDNPNVTMADLKKKE